ncbi:hypothetical protein BDC45DRAFT_512882 [Circinella umbellata]|nr:hypothetical protein BDC45DRAFT_512882 [Circinella umbellata]
MNNKSQSVALPSKVNMLIKKLVDENILYVGVIESKILYFSLRKTRDQFIKKCKRTMDENEPRVNKRKIAKERRDAYEKAQRLGNALTVRGLNEFQNQYIDGETSSAAEEATTQVSETTEDESTQISTLETTTFTTPTKKLHF